MRTYTFAQSLVNKQLKGYHCTVITEETNNFDNWIVANIQFLSVTSQNKRDQEIKNLPICNIGLFQIHQQLKSFSLVANTVKESQEIIIQLKPNKASNLTGKVLAENSQYMFFQDLVSVIKIKFNGTLIQEGKCDFFTLVQHLQWSSQKSILQKQKKSFYGINWSQIAKWMIGSALVIGIIGIHFKKKQ